MKTRYEDVYRNMSLYIFETFGCFVTSVAVRKW